MMEFNYAEQTTPELLDLLVAEEDRVTLAHIQELAARADAVEPLRAWLLDETRWLSDTHGVVWGIYHAFTILCLGRRVEALDDLLRALELAHAYKFDWITDVGSAALAHLGAAAADPLLAYVKAPPDADATKHKPTVERVIALQALMRLAVVDAAVREWLVEITGREFADKLATFEQTSADFQHEFHEEFLKFYQPDEIAARQARWQQEAEKKARQEAEDEALQKSWRAAPADQLPMRYTRGMLGLPAAGLSKDAAGTLRRETKTVGRNEPCPCGSGKKYKKCCGA
jgi:hypothetical protein